MARTADHDLRRAQIADAVLRVAADAGLNAVTVAKVADRAGFSVGLIQHYFASKELLIGSAHAECLRRLNSRIADLVDAGESRGHSIRRMAGVGLAELLPLDPQRRTECEIRAEFEAWAIRDADLSAVAASTATELRRRLAHVIDNGKRCGEVESDTDAPLSAYELLATVEGLAADGLRGGDPQDIRAVLDSALDRVFPGRCRHHG